MAVKLPKYQRQVSVSSEAGGVRGDIGSAGAEFGAMARFAETAGGVVQKVSGAIQKKKKEEEVLQNKIKTEVSKKEQSLIRNIFESQTKIYQASYGEANAGRLDYNQIGQEGDEVTKTFRNDLYQALQIPGLEKYPTLEATLRIEADTLFNVGGANARATALRRLTEDARLATKASVNAMITANDPVGAGDKIRAETGVSITVGEASAMLAKIPAEIDQNAAFKAIGENPQQVITDITLQIEGGDRKYSSLSDEQEKSVLAYARQRHTDNQMKTAAELYDMGSKYPGMTQDEKIEFLDEKRVNGSISAGTYEKEMKLIREPAEINITPAHNKRWLQLEADLRAAGDNATKHASILSSMGDGEDSLPRSMKVSLYETSKSVLDPMSTYNRGKVGFAFEQVDLAFDINKVMPEAISRTSPMRPFWGTPWIEGYAERREAIANRAKYEIKTAVTDWLRTDGANATPVEIQRRVADEILAAQERFGVKNLPKIIEGIEKPPPTTSKKAIKPPTEIPDDTGNAVIERLRRAKEGQ